MPNYSIKKNKWENIEVETTAIPEIIRNSSDENVIAHFLKNNKSSLSAKEISFLEHRQESMRKINIKKAELNKKLEAGQYSEKKAVVTADPGKGSYILKGIKQPSFQTADNGCWSCFYQMLLQSRGINDLTQEDIRAYRPEVIGGNGTFSKDADKEMNTDSRMNAIDMGDLAISLVPDSMLKSTEIWSYKKYKGGDDSNQEEKKTYFDSAVAGIKNTIIGAIKDHSSPVGLMMDGHYITIIGIEGDTVLYKNSMPGKESNGKPDHTFRKDISELIGPALNGENAEALTITWMEDILMSKSEDRVYNAPQPNVWVFKGSTMMKTKENQEFFADERHQNGMVIASTGGIDVADEDAEYRMHLRNGFFSVEKAYIPRKLDRDRLRGKAAQRDDQLEQSLKNANSKRLQESFDYKKEINIAKASKVNIVQNVEEKKEPRFHVPVVFSGRPFYGEGNFVDFKNNLQAVGWDKNKLQNLMGALSNIYDAFPLETMPAHRQAMDILFAHSFMTVDNPPGSVSSLKRRLQDFMNTVQNGGTMFSDFGDEYKLLGLKDNKDIRVATAVSVQYINSFINALAEVEKVAPYINAGSLDIDSFIDVDGKVKTDVIKNTPVIKEILDAKAPKDNIVKDVPAAGNDNRIIKDAENVIKDEPDVEENNNVFLYDDEDNIKKYDIKYDDDGISVSPKCKFKIMNVGYSKQVALELLNNMDNIPQEEKDPNLIFTLLLTANYWKPTQRYDGIYFSENDLEYLAERYETDPDFAQNIEDIIKYGYGEEFWGWNDRWSRYLYQHELLEVQDIIVFKEGERRRTVFADDVNDIIDKSEKKLKKDTENIKSEISRLKKDWESRAKEEKNFIKSEKEASGRTFRKLKEDVVKAEKSFDPVAFEKNPTFNYREAASIIIKSNLSEFKIASPGVINSSKSGRNINIEVKANSLANEFDFTMYMKEKASKLPIISIDEFTQGFADFKAQIQENEKDISVEKKPFFKESPEAYTMQTVVAAAKTKLSEASNISKPYERLSMMEAVDTVIAKTLTTKAAESSFFGKIKTAEGNSLDVTKMNARISDARKELMNDSCFLQTFAKRVPAKDFYKEYTKMLNAEVNRKIKAENARKKDIRRGRGEERRINEYLNTHKQTITDKEAAELRTAYENLTEFNKGKSPSSAMEKLMKTFKKVIDEMGEDGKGRDITLMNIHKLNKYVLKYYDARQGVFHDPYTGLGKARLAEIEKLSKTTDVMVRIMREDHPDVNRNSEVLARTAERESGHVYKKAEVQNAAPQPEKAPEMEYVASKVGETSPVKKGLRP